VSVIFSGVMVPVGLFGLGRLLTIAFAGVPAVTMLAHLMLVPLGAITAVVGGFMALQQTHLKRLLAYSTVSHLGLMLATLSLLTTHGTAGWLLYMFGHGLVKGSLFMAAGMLAAEQGSVDELELYGRARGYPVLGAAFAMAGLCLAGLPAGVMGAGAEAMEGAARLAGRDWLGPILMVASATTGGAVLRAGQGAACR
jgi:multicomponent Na+:H+ antiporter subunit D